MMFVFLTLCQVSFALDPSANATLVSSNTTLSPSANTALAPAATTNSVRTTSVLPPNNTRTPSVNLTLNETLPYPPLPGLPPGFRPFSALSKKAKAKAKAKGKTKASAKFQPPISLPNAPAQSQQIRDADKAKLSNGQVLQLLTNSSEVPFSKDAKVALAQLYDQASFRNWNIQMSQANIDALNADPTLGNSFPCNVTSGYGTSHAVTHSASSIGCRYRGAVGSLRMCVDEFHRPNGACRKLSWAVDTDAIKTKNKTATPVTIHGAEELIFGGCPVDWSMMSERMAYSLLNSLNVSASQAVHAKLFLNGKFLGVYSFVQPVDNVFTKQHYASDNNKGKGALYKEIWFNNYGMENLSVHDGPNADDFMLQVMNAINSTALTRDAATRLFNRYFDTQSFVDVTAFNSAIGNTDDWRQRHNFYWYVKEDNATDKKLVLLPWDYDRLYDNAAFTRGALQGTPWWDVKKIATPTACNAPIQPPEALANQTASTPGEVELWASIYRTLPPDLEIPVTCDKITKLLALALGPRVRARTREILDIISTQQVRSLFDTWNKQIQGALLYDPDGPLGDYMRDEQGKLISHLNEARAIALSQANEGDRLYATQSKSAR